MANVSTPLISTPPASGMFSNFHGDGVTIGTNAIPMAAKYRGPGGPSGIRATVARIAMNNQPLGSPQLAWESSWVGQPATSPLPFSSSVLSCNGAINYYGRIYVLVPTAQTPFNYAIAGIMSAEVQGGNVGSWRWETPVRVTTLNPFNDPQYISDTVSSGAICAVSNWLYVLGAKGIYYSYVLPDGRLTNWALGIPLTAEAGSMMCSMQVSPATFPGWVGKLTVIANRGGTNTFTYDVKDDGSVVNTAVISSALPNQRGWGAAYVDPYGGLFVIGGEDAGGVPSSMVQFNFYNFYTNVATGWGTSTALPAARSRFGFALQTERTAGTTDIYVAGGIATSGGAAQSTIYTCQSNVNFGQGGGSSLRNGTAGIWNTYSGSGFTATAGCAAAMSTWGGTNKPTTSQQLTPPGWPQPIHPYRFDSTASATVPQISLVVIGGTIPNVQVNTSAAILTRPWFSGTAPVFTGTPLGTGSSVTPNADGTYTIAFNLADASQSGFGLPKALAALLDGDAVTIGIQFASSATGDVSAAATISLKIGQPPTISAIVPANASTPNNGNPALSFLYNPGAGGAAQATTRVQVKQGGTTIFDSGTRQGALNSIAAMQVAPLLLPSTAYSLVIDVTSLDTPVSGSSDAATSTTAFTTAAFTRLAAPAGFTAVPVVGTGGVAFGWSAVGSATGYNLYHRRSAVGGAYYLLQGNLQGTSFTTLDHLAPGVAYDFVITTLSAVPAESVNSTPVTGVVPTIAPHRAYLHVAGQGTTFGVALDFDAEPTFANKLSTSNFLPWNSAAPSAIFGAGDFRELPFTIWLQDPTPATLQKLQDILDLAKLGNVCFYRDSMGACLTVAPLGSQAMHNFSKQTRLFDISLTEVTDLIGPYLVAGSAQGYLALTAGTRPKLAKSERLL